MNTKILHQDVRLIYVIFFGISKAGISNNYHCRIMLLLTGANPSQRKSRPRQISMSYHRKAILLK